MFSVIMPVYNKKEYVAKAIKSVLAQKHVAFELILIDDCSTDGSREVIDGYKGGNVFVYERYEPGPGGYAARNYGVSLANYDWVAFLDADDFWYEEHLELAEKLIKMNSDIDFFCFSRDKIEDGREKKFSKVVSGVISNKEAMKRYAEKDIFHTNAVIIRKSLYKMAGGFPDGRCKRGGDSDLWARILINTDRIFLSDSVTSCYVIDNSGVIYGKTKVEEIHPIYYTTKEAQRAGLDRVQLLNLKRLTNRKNIEWAKARKRNGMFSVRQLKIIFPGALTLKTVYGLLTLLIPNQIWGWWTFCKKRLL